jgi:glycosyltransferase involved in cell wall biosynthesis
MSQKAVSIVLGTYNRLNFLKLTIESIRNEQRLIKLPTEIIVIDGGSTDGTISWLAKQRDVITIIQHNRGIWGGKKIERRSWGYFMNLGFKSAQGKYICMISDDCLIIPDAIKNGYNLFEEQLKNNKKIGALAFFYRNIPFFYKDWKKSGTYFVNKVFDKFYLNHGLFLKSALEEVDYIDEERYKFYCADVDLSFKLQEKNYACMPAPNSFIEHYPHANVTVRKKNEGPSVDDFYALQKKWGVLTPQEKSFSSIQKVFFDKDKTVQKFSRAHFTNVGLWSQIIKNSRIFRTLGRK